MMSETRVRESTISAYVPGHGRAWVTSAAMDAAIARYLPASPAKLRALCEERTGLDFGNVYDVSTFLVMLADFDYNMDGNPLALATYQYDDDDEKDVEAALAAHESYLDSIVDGTY